MTSTLRGVSINDKDVIAFAETDGKLFPIGGSNNALDVNVKESVGDTGTIDLNGHLTTDIVYVVVGDINGTTYQSGCEGQIKTTNVYKTSLGSGLPSLLTTMQYGDSANVTKPTKIVESESVTP